MGIENKKELKGIKGWLMLLVFYLIILEPAASISSAYFRISHLFSVAPELANEVGYQHFAYAWCGGIFFTALLSIFAGYKLWRDHRKESVKLAIVIMWLVRILSILMVIFLPWLATGEINFSQPALMIKEQMPSIVYTFLWSFYLYDSKRVKNTYIN